MVEILCPHCDEEIALEDDASGEFECPFCEGEFEWNIDPEMDTSQKANREGGSVVDHPIQWIGHGFTAFMLFFMVLFFFSSSYYSYTTGGSDSDEIMTFGRTSENSGIISIEYSKQAQLLEEGYKECLNDDEMEGMELLCEFQNAMAEYYSSWNTAGLILTLTFSLAMLCSVIAITTRILMMLERSSVLDLSVGVLKFSYVYARYIPFVISGLMLIGTFLFMVISPTGDIPGMLDMPELDGSFGIMIWFALLLSVIYPIVNVVDMKVS
tara:strand:+ start:32 stop:835 length:804 start_codon:yes stop_codon:yes gene_type:complete